MSPEEKDSLLAKLKEIDIDEVNDELTRIGKKLYAKGLTDWYDQSWEHPDPKVDAVFGDLHQADLDGRHGFGAAYLDSCMMCVNPECARGKDAGWTCNHFQRMGGERA